MALALYRRYRPDTFDGVIGQDQVTVPLMRALDEGKLTHAYLFSGPRGCGKTSSARILARCVNCAQGPTSHPCGECESCRDLATGGPGSIDVVEIDAASHNGVDDARELRERAGFAPARDRYKIFILDEAHMVTPQGFNALLKIVEEPPEHVMFIFATTEPDKVIGTIRSRTHHYPFRLVPSEVMGPYLEDICAKEGIKPEAGVLKLAMRAGGGSMRDTLSVLDQLMVGAVDGVITHDASVALLGFTPETLIGEAVDAVIDRNGEALYGVIQKVVVGGFDPKRFVEDLLARVRDLLVLTLAGDRAESVLSDTAEGEDMGDLHRQAAALGLGPLTAMADTINTTLGAMSGATSPRMRLELLAARLLAGREGLADGQNAPGMGGTAGGASANGMPGTSGMGAAMNATAGGTIAGGIHAAPARGSGFAGAARNQKPAEPVAQQPAQTGGFAGASRNQPDSAPRPAVQPQQTAPAVGVEGAQTPDEQWDGLVASLPEDVRAYVNRTKVPRVNFTEQPGNRRLWIKFDVPLSKYAFAMAMAAESVNGATKVVDILRAEVRRVFGSDVSLAPTNKMANGEVAPPMSKLPASEQQQIKAKLLQANLGAAVAATQGLGENRGHAADDRPAAGPASDGAPDDDDSHRGGAQSGNGVDPVGLNDDPWAAPAVPATAPTAVSATSAATARLGTSAGAVVPADAGASATRGGAGRETSALDDDDPWAHPMAEEPPVVTAPAEEHHKKHVAVPDLSDDSDPWATPSVPSSASPSAGTPVAPVVPAGSVSPTAGASSSYGMGASGPEGSSGTGFGPGLGARAAQSDIANEDPWKDVPAPSSEFAPAGGSDDGGWPLPGPVRPGAGMGANMGAGNAGGAGMGTGNASFGGTPMPQAPQVSADRDVYSMSDESLDEATALELDDIRRMFDVKTVEDFAPDDPRNPRNVKPAAHADAAA